MLPARGTTSEPAVVGNVDQHLGAVIGELPHELREDRFVADESADPVRAYGRHYHALARGHRELPIEAQFVGRTVQTTDDEIIEVKFQEIDQLEKVLMVEKVAESEAV